jgi:hypothetical protein
MLYSFDFLTLLKQSPPTLQVDLHIKFGRGLKFPVAEARRAPQHQLQVDT